MRKITRRSVFTHGARFSFGGWVGSSLAKEAPHTPVERRFHFEYAVSIPPTGAKGALQLWAPLPHDDDYQRIRSIQINSPRPYQTKTGGHGNKMLYLSGAEPQTQLPLTIRFEAVRKEHRQPAVTGGPRNGKPESSAALAQYLKPDRLVPLNNQIRGWACEVVEKAGAKTDLEKTRAIYDHVVATVKYDKTGKGWGRGDIYYACEERRGNCTDFHAIVIGYARALGLPARFAIGFPIPPDRGTGQIAGYHCWAEVYTQQAGWVPIDASEAAKNPSKREYFFGALDENRLEFTRGRDLVLAPPQGGDPLNYFIYPYAEAEGKPLAGAAWTARYQDLA